MPTYVAFLRAVNVGGTGKLPMADLRRVCGEIGFANVQTYIASGNVVFTSNDSKPAVKAALENELQAYAGKPVKAVVRTVAELRAILENNPFQEKDPKRVTALLLDGKPPEDAIEQVAGQADEELSVGAQEIYVHYPGGMGQSRLRIPAAGSGTARNMNTIARMVELAATVPAP